MYNSNSPATYNVIPLNSKSTKNSTKRKKNKSRENITIIPSKVNDVFNRVPIKETYCKLVMLADESGTLIIRIRTLAKFLNTGEKTISRNLKELHIRGLIIKDKFLDEYGYQKMIIHIVNYNKLAEKDTHVGKPGKDVVGQLVNNQLYDRDAAGQIITKQFYETLPFSNELTKDSHELTNKIYESGLLYNEEQKSKMEYTNEKQTLAHERAVILRESLESDPAFEAKPSVSEPTVSSFDSKHKKSVIHQLKAYGFWQGQAEGAVDKHGQEMVQSAIDYAVSKVPKSGLGKYLNVMLQVPQGQLYIPDDTKEGVDEKQASEDRKKLCQEHWENIDNFWKKNYKAFELYQNTRLDEHKGIIFKTLEILNSNPKAYPNYPFYEDLNGKTTTVSNLRIICDRLIGENPNQLMEEGKTSQEPSKNIVPHQVEKANKPTEKPSAGILADIIKRTSGADNFMAKVLAAKKQTNVNKVEKNRMVNEAFIEAVNKSNPTKNGSLFKNEPVSEPVGGQLSQAFSLKTDSKNEPVQNENEPVKLTSPKNDQISHTLSDRQNKIVAYISKANKPSTQDISNQFTGVSKSSIKRDIKKLTELGQIRTEGENKFTYYCLND